MRKLFDTLAPYLIGAFLMAIAIRTIHDFQAAEMIGAARGQCEALRLTLDALKED